MNSTCIFCRIIAEGDPGKIVFSDASLAGHVTLIASRIARKEGFAENGFRLVVNCNGDGGQTVWHLHYHLLAGRHLHWPPG